jgi:hypothetical protein
MSELTPIEGDPLSSTRRALHGIDALADFFRAGRDLAR